MLESGTITGNHVTEQGGGVFIDEGTALVCGVILDSYTTNVGCVHTGQTVMVPTLHRNKLNGTSITMISGKLYGNTGSSHSADVYFGSAGAISGD